MDNWNSDLATHRFEKFLLDNWRGKSPGELASVWNRENARHQTNSVLVVHSLSELKIKISTDEIQNINSLRKKEDSIKQSGKRTKSFDVEIKTERIRLMMARVEKHRDLWTGSELNQEEACV